METLSKADDEDEYKNDTDPQGYFTYKKLVSACAFALLKFLAVVVARFIDKTLTDLICYCCLRSWTTNSILYSGLKKLQA